MLEPIDLGFLKITRLVRNERFPPAAHQASLKKRLFSKGPLAALSNAEAGQFVDDRQPRYQVLLGPRESKTGTAGLRFKINPSFHPPLSLADAQVTSRSLCINCPFNPANQQVQSPFIARCDTFDGRDLVIKITIHTKAARQEVLKNASCQPSPVRTLL